MGLILTKKNTKFAKNPSKLLASPFQTMQFNKSVTRDVYIIIGNKFIQNTKVITKMYMYTIVVHVLLQKLPQCVPYQNHEIFSPANKVLILQSIHFD